jgi:hypothetical protein
MTRLPDRSHAEPPASVTPADFAELQRSLDECTRNVERLARDSEIHVKRMAAMQAEIDYLKARLRE